jgi:hypothetical protein
MAENIQKELLDVSRALKALASKVEKMQKQANRLSAPKAAKKGTAAKPPMRKTDATSTAAVLSVVRRSKKGVSSTDIIQKTGFGRKKVENIVFRLRKQGKIGNAAKGLYVKA